MQAAFSRDSNVIAVASIEGNVGVWTVEDSHLVAPLIKLAQAVERVEFSPDGGILAATSGLTITLWDTQTWLKLREFKAHDNQILMIAFPPDGQRLVSAPTTSAEDLGRRFGRMIGQPIGAEQPHCYFQISPDGRSLATRSQSGVVRIWDAMTGLAISKPFEHEGPVTDLAFTPDGRSLLTCSQDGTAQAWDIQHGRPLSSILKTEYRYSSACFTRDGRQVVGTTAATALMFDVATGEQVGRPMIHANPIYRMKASPDGRKLVTATWDGSARIWDLHTGGPLTPMLLHSQRLFGVAFSPDSRLVATASEDGTARLWDAETGNPKSPPLRHDADINVAFRPDSRMLLTAGVDGMARLWSTADGRCMAGAHPSQRHRMDRGVRSVGAADCDCVRRQVRDGLGCAVPSSLIRPIRHERGVIGARFSPDGRWS
jgi:WD40 repeat protein